MIEKTDSVQVFRDPIYGYIHVEYKFIKDLIDTFAFQRLRRIKQLSGVCMVFHCAEHSRFSHSLGVYELANRVIQNRDISKTFSDYEKLLFLTSALLHDIGHGAYSHAFEDTFKTNHEHLGSLIILENKEIRSILDTVGENFAQDCADVLLHKSKYLIIELLLSSQIDIDRLDYLGRDSYFTGAPYGYVDFERIIRLLRISNNSIVFKESGIHAIENYLVARYHMYWQVYYHKTARGYEVILNSIYKRIYDLIVKHYKFSANISLLESFAKDTLDINTYLQIDDQYINSLIIALLQEKDEILKTLAYDFTHRNIWKSIIVNKTNKNLILNIKKNLNPYYYATRSVAQNTYSEKNTYDEDIKIITENKEVITLTKVSPVIKSLQTSGSKEDLRFFYRVSL